MKFIENDITTSNYYVRYFNGRTNFVLNKCVVCGGKLSSFKYSTEFMNRRNYLCSLHYGLNSTVWIVRIIEHLKNKMFKKGGRNYVPVTVNRDKSSNQGIWPVP